jgi:hypothetical protein
MPACTNHPAVETAGGCAWCRRPYCPACLVEFLGQPHCGPCRDYRLSQMQGTPVQAVSTPPTLGDHIIPAKNPMALASYYTGVFSLIPCVGLVLGPAALVLGIMGLKARARDPNLPGQTHAIVGIVLGSIATLLYGGLVILMLIGMLVGR